MHTSAPAKAAAGGCIRREHVSRRDECLSLCVLETEGSVFALSRWNAKRATVVRRRRAGAPGTASVRDIVSTRVTGIADECPYGVKVPLCCSWILFVLKKKKKKSDIPPPAVDQLRSSSSVPKFRPTQGRRLGRHLPEFAARARRVRASLPTRPAAVAWPTRCLCASSTRLCACFGHTVLAALSLYRTAFDRVSANSLALIAVPSAPQRQTHDQYPRPHLSDLTEEQHDLGARY